MLLSLFPSPAVASPLDDKITAFKEAPTQTETAVGELLELGLKEERAAAALAVVQPWLAANPSSSQAVLFYAGRSMQYAGEWSDAVVLYRKLLQNKSVDAKLAGVVVPALYGLLINDIRDSDAAYLYMRAEGNRLRAYGRAKQFDAWFIDETKRREDIPALCERLGHIYRTSTPAAPPSTTDLEWLCRKLEGFQFTDETWAESVLTLAKIPQVPAEHRARLAWAATVTPYNRQLERLYGKKEKPDPQVSTAPLAAAAKLLQLMPDRGAFLVADGWGARLGREDSRRWQHRFEIDADKKLAQLLAVIPRMSPDKRNDLLGHRTVNTRDRFAARDMRKLAMQLPGLFNTLSAANVLLFDKTITVPEAKALAPQLARNPHAHAALIRAYAVTGTNKVSAMLPVVMKSERWRFAGDHKTSAAQRAVDTVWGSAALRDGNHGELRAKYAAEDAKPNSRFAQLTKQVAKESSSQQRMAALNALRKDLQAPAPSIPGALGLLNQIFANAPDADRVEMLMALSSDIKGEGLKLMQLAGAQCKFGGQRYAGLYCGPEYNEGWARWGRNSTLGVLRDKFGKHLTGMLEKQIAAGKIDEPLLGFWLYSVHPHHNRGFADKLVASPAYAKLDPAYRELTARFHGDKARLPTPEQLERRGLSRELRELPREATPAQVEAAFKTAVTRLNKAAERLPLEAVHKVAAVPEWSDTTRTLARSLFDQLAPIGNYPEKQGHGSLAGRLIKDMQAAKRWSAIIPYTASFWRTCHTDGRVEDLLLAYAEAALEAGDASTARSIAQSGLRSGVPGLSPADENGKKRRPRLGTIAGKAAVALGAVEIPVAQDDPTYGIYKSNAEFVLGNLESAWALYLENADLFLPPEAAEDGAEPAEATDGVREGELLRKMAVDYGFWLLQRNLEAERRSEAEVFARELTIWSRQEQGLLSIEQQGELKIAYADLAFLKGALPTARAWYRKVADAREYKGSDLQVRAALGSVRIDRVTRDFGAALEELAKLMLINSPGARIKVQYARAEVLMDQENYKEAMDEVNAVLSRDPNHADARILLGELQYLMRKYEEASEIELGAAQGKHVMVPGEVLKINLTDPALQVSGVGADIEVEVWAKSGDIERVMLHPLGDSLDKFRADMPTALAPPVKGDKTLQVLGVDEIRFGYSKRFRAKMTKLPPDPKTVITIASDAHLSFSAGAFAPRSGEETLDVEALGLSSAQARLGSRTVRPGNPVYVRVIDPDKSKTAGIDEVIVEIEASSGDSIRRLVLKETGPYTGEFEGVVPTAGAQAMAFASDSAAGRDPNTAICPKASAGWMGKVGEKGKANTYTIDLNDNVPIDTMTLQWLGEQQALTHFVVQTSMNGKEWINRARYPVGNALQDGRPRISMFRTAGSKDASANLTVSQAKGTHVPRDWYAKMALHTAMPGCRYFAAYMPSLTNLPSFVNEEKRVHSWDTFLVQYSAQFYQAEKAVRAFQLSGIPATNATGEAIAWFVLDGRPGGREDPMTIERELGSGLHTLDVWMQRRPLDIRADRPLLQCNVPGKGALQPCPDAMFDPATFPEGVRAQLPQPAAVTNVTGGVEFKFGDRTQARLVRLYIAGFEGDAPGIRKISMTGRDGKPYLPVKEDYMALRDNKQIEILPGDTIVARYEDELSATPDLNRHEEVLSVAFNNATIKAAFPKYETLRTGERELTLEAIRRFNLEDAISVVIDDVDMDASPKKDVIEFTAVTSEGDKTLLKAVETEEKSGVFVGRIFPVTGKPQRPSELQVPEGGTLTLTYRDVENLDPGIPTDRSVTIEHAKYKTPLLDGYTTTGKMETPRVSQRKTEDGAEPPTPKPVWRWRHARVPESELATTELKSVIGDKVRFDVLAPHLALSESSAINAYVQVGGSRALGERGLHVAPSRREGGPSSSYDITLPGTLKLSVPASLAEGRFRFSIPLAIGEKPSGSFATGSDTITEESIPDGLVVSVGDVINIGYAYKDKAGTLNWKTVQSKVIADRATFAVTAGARDNKPLERRFVGERVFVRVRCLALDRGPGEDTTTINLTASSGAAAKMKLVETQDHSGVFEGVFKVTYARDELQADPAAELPPVELNGFPVRYGDDLVISYKAPGEAVTHSAPVKVNMGSDGGIEPFSKQFAGDEMAVDTSFTLAECFFELAKSHRKMDQESLARREMAHARKLLKEAIDTHHDQDMRAHAEYLLGNLSQEYADLAKNDQSKLPMYQDALARFSKIPTDYPETEFANKAQFKIGLVYDKMGEAEIAVEEYVKLAYKYPDSEHIPEVMVRLGRQFQKQGQVFKDEAEPLREKTDTKSQAEVLRLDELSYPSFIKSAVIYGKLQERFPDHKLAGLAGLASAQNYMRAHYDDLALEGFAKVVENEDYDDLNIRAQALYWTGLLYERMPSQLRKKAYEAYTRTTFEFPDSKWAKAARGRLTQSSFENIAAAERKRRKAIREYTQRARGEAKGKQKTSGALKGLLKGD
ncbi:MAG: tetratricopeptide repeat protein [Verrucomicrobia bacterium]|nr:tetratricopeptide repeat protein [Verrucomicrobiota bacterium]MBT7701265.1 tetratricopeptide repeat protein [Verrucomicrobiota bacterium]